MSAPIVFVLKGYPRLSETFIAQEIRALEGLGVAIAIVSLRRPTDRARHPVHDEIAAPVTYLPEYLKEAPRRVLAGLARAARLPGFGRAARLWLSDLRRDPTANRVRRFGQACVLAAEMGGGAARFHAHFLHTPASVARYAAAMTRKPWSVSAHAVDIWTTPAWEKRAKLADAAFCVTCTEAGRAHLAALAPTPARVALHYHGLDLSRFPPPPPRERAPDGSSAETAVEILAVGRAVEKKGFAVLLDALAALPPGLHWRCTHIGGGEGLGALKSKARALGLGERIRWLGPQPQTVVRDAYRAADLFVLPCRIAANGDRDGLPNVLMEAQSQRLAVVSTTVSGIPELVREGVTGRLVAPDDAPALAAAITELARNPGMRERMGAAGERRVREAFSLEQTIAGLAARFGVPAPSHEAEEPACVSLSMRP